MQKSWKFPALIVVLCLATLMSGCYGPFNLTQRLHDWNGSAVENEWGQEGLFLLLSPVYGLCTLGDAIIFNSIEFWGGENPISPPMASADDLQSEMDQVAAVYGLPADLIVTARAY